ncbi:DUF1049 domain-containing protein [Phormidesmis priestleyi ULC007]|uniref:DUF1049 domain-containing protein n=1 Tax=Phormidesmis priestleyi ULC007 TaxID=1920490 RepID=A0A2T1D4Y7_9CYAN|nr:DUF1049 domain-containing protein [Phormidesmis priestleyi]PSB15521.1 DUF1049 domain-containing protein [Phormidesmis priestleyi ULC007]PZO46380.1 MAG: DUF1049 domain-containing protein [Phormidesmis priestleyi]
MKSLATLITSLIIAVWIGAIALISVQNATPLSLRFLSFQLVEMPFGLILAFSAGVGVIGTAIAQPLLGFSSPQRDQDDDDDF